MCQHDVMFSEANFFLKLVLLVVVSGFVCCLFFIFLLHLKNSYCCKRCTRSSGGWPWEYVLVYSRRECGFMLITQVLGFVFLLVLFLFFFNFIFCLYGSENGKDIYVMKGFTVCRVSLLSLFNIRILKKASG